MNWHWLFTYGHFCGMSVHLTKCHSTEVFQVAATQTATVRGRRAPWRTLPSSPSWSEGYWPWQRATLSWCGGSLPPTQRPPETLTPSEPPTGCCPHQSPCHQDPPQCHLSRDRLMTMKQRMKFNNMLMSTIKPTEQFDKDPQDYTTKNEVQHGINVSQN